jgi:hypothetical protein
VRTEAGVSPLAWSCAGNPGTDRWSQLTPTLAYLRRKGPTMRHWFSQRRWPQPIVALVLQPHLSEALTAADVGAFGLGLVATTPSGPLQNLCRHGWWLPDERKE